MSSYLYSVGKSLGQSLFMVLTLYQPLHYPLDLLAVTAQTAFQTIRTHWAFFSIQNTAYVLGTVQNCTAILHKMTDASLTIIAPEFQRTNWFSWVEIVREVSSLTHLSTNIEDLLYLKHYTKSWGSKTEQDRQLGRIFSCFLLQRSCNSMDLVHRGLALRSDLVLIE